MTNTETTAPICNVVRNTTAHRSAGCTGQVEWSDYYQSFLCGGHHEYADAEEARLDL